MTTVTAYASPIAISAARYAFGVQRYRMLELMIRPMMSVWSSRHMRTPMEKGDYAYTAAAPRIPGVWQSLFKGAARLLPVGAVDNVVVTRPPSPLQGVYFHAV